MAKIITARDVECPQCQAGPGVACGGSINGLPASIPVHHSLRRSIARELRERQSGAWYSERSL